MLQARNCTIKSQAKSYRRSETALTRPDRPASRHPPARPVSPYTDWSSLSDNAEVITIPSEDDEYVLRSPEYEPNSPGRVQDAED